MSGGRAALAVLVIAAAAGGGWWWWQENQGPEPTRYAVQRGDTLWAIAKAHGVTVDELRSWNALTGDTIEVGQQLEIWLDGAPSEPATGASSKRRRRRRSAGGPTPGPEATPDASASGSWTLPPARTCLEGPDPDAALEGGDEAAFAASVGLSRGQVKAGMDAHLPALSQCLRPGEPVSGTLELEVTVACTGRVSAVEVLHGGGLPDWLVSCVQRGVGFAGFPAHDMPDGYTFQYPMRFSD